MKSTRTIATLTLTFLAVPWSIGLLSADPYSPSGDSAPGYSSLGYSSPVSPAAAYSSPGHPGPGYPYPPHPPTVSDYQAARTVLQNTTGVSAVVPFGPLVRFEGNFGDGTGFDGNYYDVNAFLPYHLDPGYNLLFANLHGAVTRDGEGIGNFGGGYRHYVPWLDRIFGISGWYDIDGGHSKTYHRFGGSAESLGKYLDFRVNSYFVTNDDSAVLLDQFLGDPFFQGNRILLTRQRLIESAYSGFEFEVGGPLPFLGRSGLNGYLGGYFLDADQGEDATGIKGRFEALVTDDLTVGVQASGDSVFGTNAWVTIALTLPDGKPSRWFKPRPVQERLGAPVQRIYRVQANVESELTNPAAVNPITGEPFFVTHIDPNAAESGAGTFERPLSDLADFVNAPTIDIIRVLPRSDATFTNLTLDETLQLFPNQRLLSAARPHLLTPTQGTFLLPSFTPAAGDLPMIRLVNADPESPIIRLADNNEVSGFLLDGGLDTTMAKNVVHDGIVGDNIVDFSINNNVIQNARNAVVLTNATGTGIFVNNVLQNNTGDGFRLRNEKSGTLNLSLLGNIAINNGPIADPSTLPPPTGADPPPQTQGGVGFNIVTAGVINANDLEADLPLGIVGNIAVNNGTGLFLGTLPGGLINAIVQNNIFDGNTDVSTGMRVVADGGSINLESVAFNSFSDNAFNGVLVSALNDGAIAIPEFVENLVVNNGSHGIHILSSGAKSSVDFNIGALPEDPWPPIPPSNIITGNGIGANGGDGIRIATSNFGTANVAIVNNDLSNNIGNSVGVITDLTGVNTAIKADFGNITLDVLRNNLNRDVTGTSGVFIDTFGTDVVARIAGNSIVGRPAEPDDGDPTTSEDPGSGFGVFAAFRDGTFDLTVGGTTVDDINIIDQNTGAGIAVTLQDDAVGTFNILNNRITRTTDDDPLASVPNPFQGDGIHVRLVGSTRLKNAEAVLSSSLVAGVRPTISGNVIGDTLDPTLGNEGRGIHVFFSEETEIQDLLIANNIIANNGDDGIQFLRADSARARIVNPRPMQFQPITISGNRIEANTGDGIEIIARGTADPIGFDIVGNQITDNTDNGIALMVEADARLDVDIRNNLIDNNGLNGIVTTERVNDRTDLREIGGMWLNNMITNNAGYGILINGTMTNLLNLDPNELIVANNLIDMNGLSGIEINAGGRGTFINNVITRSGLNALTDPTVGHGVDIQGVSFKELIFIANTIRDNRGDGFEINNNSESNGFVVVLEDNTIEFNDGRGVDILNQGGTQALPVFTDIALRNNKIASNGGEGVYVVNTSSTTQDQSSPTPLVMESDGAVNALTFLRLEMTENRIVTNGANSAFEGTGFVLRVGTNDGGRMDFTDPGGFASETIFDPFTGQLVQVQSRGGVVAKVNDNEFGGNFGVDVFIESFTSTVDPVATAGTWSATVFNVTTFQSDPLARLDLVFRGNTGDSISVTNLGAFYNNAEAVFKSRLNTQTPPGPFTSATRRRNAQRLASRDGLPPFTGPDGGRFLYPGMGESTFRIESDFEEDGFLVLDFGFLVDPFGVNFVPTVFGEEPFSWGTVAPGTFDRLLLFPITTTPLP